jgi:hypothetical protein
VLFHLQNFSLFQNTRNFIYIAIGETICIKTAAKIMHVRKLICYMGCVKKGFKGDSIIVPFQMSWSLLLLFTSSTLAMLIIVASPTESTKKMNGSSEMGLSY